MANDGAGRDVAGVLLAGGLSRRMGGGDKTLRPLGGRSILAHVIDRIRPQVAALALNANGDPARFAEYDLLVIADSIEGFAGPLAGVLAGLDWAAEAAPDCRWLLSAPTDAPFLPRDLVARLMSSAGTEAKVAVAMSGGRTHPVVALWAASLRAPLRRALESGIRKVEDFTKDYSVAAVEFATDPIDPFFNLNRPEDLAEAERVLLGTAGSEDRLWHRLSRGSYESGCREMILDRARSALLIVDVQERLAPAIANIEDILARIELLIRAASGLGVPIGFTEQYSAGLGATVSPIRDLAPEAPVIVKVHFQATLEPGLEAWIGQNGARQIVVAGTEAHVCVLQTTLGLIERGYATFLVGDAVGSRRDRDRALAIERLRSEGCRIVSAEMVVFEWLKKAATEEFRAILPLIKRVD